MDPIPPRDGPHRSTWLCARQRPVWKVCPMTSTPVEQLAKVLDATEQLIAAVRAEQWAAPTPCTEWNVRDLVNHLVAGNRMFAGILHGDAATPADIPRLQAVDVLGDEPVAAYRDAADAVLTAFSQPGVLEKVFTVPVGTVPGIVALHLRITEVLVHGWDLARDPPSRPVPRRHRRAGAGVHPRQARRRPLHPTSVRTTTASARRRSGDRPARRLSRPSRHRRSRAAAEQQQQQQQQQTKTSCSGR
ncbi:MAG: hypothetical protein JWL58_1628 [Streptosporangiaceae bacterium]|nr:hypothetical protein [Streptosporangiaceae bacterium]